MKVYSMKYSDLEYWVKNKAEPGDIATYYVNNGEFGEFMYTYYYTKPDDNPRWCMWSDMKKLQKYLDNLGVTKMNKKCENCKYYKHAGDLNFCSHKEHNGVIVPKYTSCPEHEFTQKSEAPFDNLKFFVKDQKTGELEIKYICEDCGKLMEAPFHWQLRVPFGANKDPDKRPGYYYWCEECWEKEKKK